MTVTVITVSDRASRGEYEDLSGPEIEKIILEAYPDCRIRKIIVPDEERPLRYALREGLGDDFILTTGGTGLSPRDITPDVSRQFCDKELPGIAETLRSESFKETPMAMLSRGYAGLRDKTVVINFPGSVKAVRLCTGVILPLLSHAPKMIRGEGH